MNRVGEHVRGQLEIFDGDLIAMGLEHELQRSRSVDHALSEGRVATQVLHRLEPAAHERPLVALEGEHVAHHAFDGLRQRRVSRQPRELRRVFLRNVSTSVELVACVAGQGGEISRWVKTADGMDAGGFALAAMTEKIATSTDWSGVRFIDDVTELQPIVARANVLAGTSLIELSPSSPQR